VPYLYVVLNGNNQCIKIRFPDKKIIWQSNTGVAPFGICIVRNKAYITNWGGPLVTDTTKEFAGTPWGSAYTNPVTGGTAKGSLSVIDLTTGSLVDELPLGLHPTAIINSPDKRLLYVANGNSDYISVIDVNKETVVDSIDIGLFSKQYAYYGSSPGALQIDSSGTTLYVANGLDNAVAVIPLRNWQEGQNGNGAKGTGNSVAGYIPTEAYPSGIILSRNRLYVTNLEAKGARVLSDAGGDLPAAGNNTMAYNVHKQLASISIIPLPARTELAAYTERVKKMNLFYRIALTNRLPRAGRRPLPVPERIGEPSLFRHVIYVVKENKTYDQVFGDLKQGRGMPKLCIYGDSITPNQHLLASDFSLLDNYYASGKSSAEGHQWTDAAMVSDYIERNVRAWFRSYPHRQADALVYNKNGFIWNNALDHGKKVRIYGEACLTHYDTKMNWFALYDKYLNREDIKQYNTSTIARIRPVISANYPDCDNINFTDQLRADIFIEELNKAAAEPGDSLPEFIELSLPDDHTAGTSPNFPTPRAMVADNDLAVGRIIEAVSHSRFWDSTVIFVTEDDSQSGWDHISSYRTTCLVISPYSNLNKTIHTQYNQTSMVRTIEQILGLPPMNIIDATALPMFDCFTNTKSAFRYQSVANKISLREMNKPYSLLQGRALQYARLSANSAFKEVDGGDDDLMNRILWFAAKGTEKYPVNSR
jgi:YVTN family beta-propeller protein